MRAGDLVRVDFGIPVGSEPGFVRPAVVVTADAVLAASPRTIHVVPVTSNVRRSLWGEVPVDAEELAGPSVAQAHLCQVISRSAVLEEDLGKVGPLVLAQVRSVVADLLDLP